jgi:DNA-binding CsgD family transcriptional regulator
MAQTQNVFPSVLDELRTHPLIPLGFSLFWTWVWMIVQISFLNSESLVVATPGMLKWIIPLTAYGLTFFLIGFLYKLKRFNPQGMGYPVTFALLTSFGVATCAMFSYYPTSNATLTSLLLVTGALIMGAGTACLHLEWGRILGRLGPRKTIIHGTFGTFGAMLFLLIVSWLPDAAIWAVLALLPPCCVATIILQNRRLPAAEAKPVQTQLNIPWRFLCTSFIQGTAFGILQSILLIMGSSAAVTAISATGSFVGATALFLVVFFSRLDFNQLMYHVGFVILALSFVLMAAAGYLFTGGWLLNAIGYRFIDILMWALCTHLIKQRGLPTNWVFAVTTGTLLIGQVVGALVGAFVRETVILPHSSLEMLSLCMVFVILVGALFMSNKNNLQKGWGMIRPSDNDEDGDFQVSCALIADGFELTPRELEVFALLAQGYNKGHISKTLFLSRETVKTHTRNLYRKMSLHSQEELIALTLKHRQGASPLPSFPPRRQVVGAPNNE